MAIHIRQGKARPLFLTEEISPAPEDFLINMRDASLRGKMFVKDTLPRIQSDNVSKAIGEQLQRVGPLVPGREAISHALRAGFLQGLKEKFVVDQKPWPRDLKLTLTSYIGTLFQGEMTEALLGLSLQDRGKLFNRFDWMEVDQETWRTGYIGAMAVARVAHTFLLSGADVFLSPPRYDLFHSGDLLVTVPNKPFGLYLQIKSSVYEKEHHAIVLASLSELSDVNLLEFQTVLINLWKGFQKFQEQNNEDWKPVFIQLGNTYTPSHELNVKPVEKLIDMFLANLTSNQKNTLLEEG